MVTQEWQQKNYEKWLEMDFNTELIPLMRKCYEIASEDTEFKIPYTQVVLDNIKIITNKEPMVMTYKQYKSFMAYHNHNAYKEVKVDKLYKN